MLLTGLGYTCDKFKVMFNETCVRVYKPNKYTSKLWDEVSKSPIYYTEAESYHTLTSYIRDAMNELDIDLDELHEFTQWLHVDYSSRLEKLYKNNMGVIHYDNYRN
jgi:hypothetical protein